MLPWFIRVLLFNLIKKKQPRLANLLLLSKPMGATEYIKKIYLNQKKREAMIYKYLADQEVDVWITPGFPMPATIHGNIWKFSYLISNAAVWNVLQYPAGIVPMSLVRKDETHFTDNINDMLTKNMQKEILGS